MHEHGIDAQHQTISHLCLLFRFIFDAMHAVTGAYAKPIFVDKLGASLVCCVHKLVIDCVV